MRRKTSKWLLSRCKYSTWGSRLGTASNTATCRPRRNNISTNSSHNNIHMMAAYSKGLSESVKNSCNKVAIQAHFKRGSTMESLLMAPKDRYNITQKNTVIYRYKCDRLECNGIHRIDVRAFGDRLKKHLRASSCIYDHAKTSDHHPKLNSFP